MALNMAEQFNVSTQDWQLIHTLQQGLPLTQRPYHTMAEQMGWTEEEVILGISGLLERGIIKRMGLIVRHHELGYQSNAMVVWDVPNEVITNVAQQLTRFDFVSLCYQRRRCLPEWPFNLYCMIHGREKHDVTYKIEQMVHHCQLNHIPRQVLFSRRRFKQCGARYDMLESRC
jgi:DNA-binding Lrp family transcriptional regulator